MYAPWILLVLSMVSFGYFGWFKTFMAYLLGVVGTETYAYSQNYECSGMSLIQYLFFGMFLFSKDRWKLNTITVARVYAMFEIGTSLISDPPQLRNYGNGKIVAHWAHAAGAAIGALVIRYL